MKFTAANDDRRVKQIMLRYFKRVAISRDINQNRSVCDTLFFFFKSQILENDIFSIAMDPCM